MHTCAGASLRSTERLCYVVLNKTRQQKTIVGTDTIEENHISRVYATPEYQGTGIGSALMDYLEREIIENYGSVEVEVSLPAGEFYIDPEIYNESQ